MYVFDSLKRTDSESFVQDFRTTLVVLYMFYTLKRTNSFVLCRITNLRKL